MATARKLSRTQLIVFAAIATPLAVVVAVLAALPGNSTPPAPDAPNGYGAELACESFMTDRLPGLTKFSDETFTGTSPTWTVTGTGEDPTLASMTTHYQCTVTIPDGKTWQLKNLQDLG